MLPSHTSKPASARMYASDSVSRLVSQLVLLQSRPCCRRTAGLGRVATGGEKEGEQGSVMVGAVLVLGGGREGGRMTRCKGLIIIMVGKTTSSNSCHAVLPVALPLHL